MDDRPADVTTRTEGWEDIRREALNDAVLYRLVTLVDHGMPKEEALIATVLGLAKIKQSLLEDVKMLMANRPATAIIIETPNTILREYKVDVLLPPRD